MCWRSPAKWRLSFMEGRQERAEPLDRAHGLSSLSGEVEAVARGDRSMQQCPLAMCPTSSSPTRSWRGSPMRHESRPAGDAGATRSGPPRVARQSLSACRRRRRQPKARQEHGPADTSTARPGRTTPLRCGCQIFESPHATCAYSWISPPRRSRRTILAGGARTAGPPGLSGGACPKARCGRWPL